MGNTMEINTVNLNGVTLRMGIRDGAPWFVVSDIVEQFNVSNYVPNGKVSVNELELVPERELYIMMLLGQAEAAEKFKQWLLTDVLGSIRVHGKYPAE